MFDLPELSNTSLKPYFSRSLRGAPWRGSPWARAAPRRPNPPAVGTRRPLKHRASRGGEPGTHLSPGAPRPHWPRCPGSRPTEGRGLPSTTWRVGNRARMGPSRSPQAGAPTTPHVALSDPVPRGDLTPRSPAAASDHGTARAADPPSLVMEAC